MARGFFSGVIAGTLVSALGLGAASVLTGLPGGKPPEATALDVPAGSEFNQSREDRQASLPEPSGSPEPSEAPKVTAPEPDDLSSLEGADTAPSALPRTGSAENTLDEPAADAGGAGVELDSDSPVLPSPQSAAPQEPEGEGELSISTDPAQPAMPEPEAESRAFPEGGQEAETAAAEPAESEPSAPDADVAQPVAPEPAEQPAPEPAPEPAEPSGSPESPEGDMAADRADTAPQSPEQAGDAAAAETGAETDDTASTIGDLAPDVTTDRLPSVTGAAPDAGTVPDETPEATAEETAEQPAEDTRPPLERYAAGFDNPGDKPLMSVVLIDDGSSPIGLDALESFPYPLSFAVDAAWPGANAAMRRYRDAGFEVLLMADLPEGASAQDAEVAMQVHFAAVPEAVAVMEGTGSGLQSSREAAEQLAPILLDSGHGLVLFPKGLNTAQKLIAREGVPAATVFRDFDAKGQSATVIRRFLDQAAFKARQEEVGVIMLGRLRPDTVSALLLWGLQDRAGSVTLAPVSALLRGG